MAGAVSDADGAAGRSDFRSIFQRILKNAGKLLGGRAVNAVLSLAYLGFAARAGR